MSPVLIVVMVSWMCTYPQTHQVIYIKCVQLLHLNFNTNEVVLKIKNVCFVLNLYISGNLLQP